MACLGYCGKVIGRESAVRLQPGMRLHASVAHGAGAVRRGGGRGAARPTCAAVAAGFSRILMTSVCLFLLALSNAVMPSCDRGGV